MSVLPLWTALEWERWRALENAEELKNLGLWRALGMGAPSALRLLERAGIEEDLSDEEEARLSKLIHRLNLTWAGMAPCELEALDFYLDQDCQPQKIKQKVEDVPPFDLPAGMREATKKGIKLHAYQRRAVIFADRPRSILALEMGLGKTLISLVSMHRAHERGEIDRVIVAAPRSAHGSWREHLSAFSNVPHALLSGETKEKRERAYTALYKGELALVVVTPQTLSLDKLYFRRILEHHKKTMLILDEAHKAKAELSAIGETVGALSPLAARVLGLTGTPQPNTISDLYHLVDRVAPDALGDASSFATRYTYRELDQWDSARGPRYRAGPLRADRLEELHARLNNVLLAISALDKDVSLSLPQRTDRAAYIPMDKQQRELLRALQYATAEREITPSAYEKALRGEKGDFLQIAAEGATANTQALGVRIEQLAISPSLFSTRFAELFPNYEAPKTAYIADEVVNYLSTEGEAAVVFCEHLGGLDEMSKALQRRGLSLESLRFYTGATSEKKRQEAAEALNTGGCKVLLGQTKALETGANLQHRAGFVAHLSTPWSPDTLAQSTARVYRQGQKRRVIVLRPSGSRIEEAKNAALARKLIQSGAATGLSSEADLAIINTAADPRVRRAHRDMGLKMGYTSSALNALIDYEAQ